MLCVQTTQAVEFFRRTRHGDLCLKTGPGECAEMLKRARAAFQSGRTANECFRQAQLDAVMRLVLEHECEFVDALGRDLHKVYCGHS